jgi:hypothetical protein
MRDDRRMPTDDTPGQRMSWTTLADVEHLLRLDKLLRATALHGDEHRYLSTYCLHDNHDACRLRCKTCDASCVCDCHRGRRDEAA